MIDGGAEISEFVGSLAHLVTDRHESFDEGHAAIFTTACGHAVGVSRTAIRPIEREDLNATSTCPTCSVLDSEEVHELPPAGGAFDLDGDVGTIDKPPDTSSDERDPS
jgi:hypothetical protein